MDAAVWFAIVSIITAGLTVAIGAIASATAEGGGACRKLGRSPPAARGRMTRALHDHIAEEIDVDYRAAEDVPFGMWLTPGHPVLAWSAARDLDRVETLVSERLVTTASQAVDAA